MTADKQPEKLTEENCADFVDRIHLESLNRRWASGMMGRHGRKPATGHPVPGNPGHANRLSDQETRPNQAE